MNSVACGIGAEVGRTVATNMKRHATIILLGLWVSRRGFKALAANFLGGKSLRWPGPEVSAASGRFDIRGPAPSSRPQIPPAADTK